MRRSGEAATRKRRSGEAEAAKTPFRRENDFACKVISVRNAVPFQAPEFIA
jgi:hypothetical protein